MFLTNAKVILDSIHRTYSKAKDASQVYEIKVKTSATKQGSRTVTEYANTLQNLWQELDHYQVFEMKCLEDAATLKKIIEKDRVYDFLADLNPKFDKVRIRILGKEEIPSLKETISLIRAEESRRGIMLEPTSFGRINLGNSKCTSPTRRKRTGRCIRAFMEKQTGQFMVYLL
ncbi:UBN2_3 domain-containing protein [Cephalotus follicularis]|uniref:UBN2_3 domain-containing protein n=1 Tax=Cephalotus follicularis TaxID=3775 RepID=A0A1Q3CEZ0_CEPFO|nr:UBN2_3 domain-containing protein [Cephalotus follicularis]